MQFLFRNLAFKGVKYYDQVSIENCTRFSKVQQQIMGKIYNKNYRKIKIGIQAKSAFKFIGNKIVYNTNMGNIIIENILTDKEIHYHNFYLKN